MHPLRLHVANSAPVRGGAFVLYWMIGARRTRFNPALDHALALARRLRRPLLVLEPLRLGYRWASVRHHTFVIQGMVDQAARFDAAGVTYWPYVEPDDGAGKGLVAALAAHACAVITDEVPGFFQPRAVAAAAAQVPCRLETVDGWGILPLRAAPGPFGLAHAFRRHAQRVLPEHLPLRPDEDPLAGYDLGRAVIPGDVLARWPSASPVELLASDVALPGLDRTVGAVSSIRGGERAAGEVLRHFLRGSGRTAPLDRYAEERSDPDADAQSGLSPWLHFGHLSAHEVVAAVLDREDWSIERLAPKPNGSRSGWWNASPAAESFLDELITWREVGAGDCFFRGAEVASYDSLPPWALDTLAKHASDPREHVYDLGQLARCETHDELWNAAQRQLVEEGRIHNYLRMLWGKKVLEWSATPREAFDALVELNNRYALDGRDPNSYTGIAWTFGRFDRPWGPVRPIFGTVRYMTSASTRKKLALDAYLARWGTASPVRGTPTLFDTRSRSAT